MTWVKRAVHFGAHFTLVKQRKEERFRSTAMGQVLPGLRKGRKADGRRRGGFALRIGNNGHSDPIEAPL